jgi:ribosome biogenesis GTPase
MSLLDWGWSSVWSERFAMYAEAGLVPARLAEGSRGIYELETARGRVRGELSGRLEYAAESAMDLPVAGDWVAVTQTDPALIVAVLERNSLLTRVEEGGARQGLAANLDVAFLVCGLDGDWNPKRLDRYLALAREAGIRPVIILNKRDLCADPELRLAQASACAPAVLLNAEHDDVAAVLGEFAGPGETAGVAGSSGVGKSTIVNALLGTAAQAIGVRYGLHTTTTRTLFRMPQGWLLLDMPGLRAVGIGGGVEQAFADITQLAARCRFTDCSHQDEPGCAVRDSIPPQRLESFRKLDREAAYQKRREDPAAAREQKERWKRMHAAMKKMPDKRR